MRDGAGAVSGPVACPSRRFVALVIPVGIAPGSRRIERLHAATGRRGSGWVQGGVGHLRLDP
jgi:hypothetical protein